MTAGADAFRFLSHRETGEDAAELSRAWEFLRGWAGLRPGDYSETDELTGESWHYMGTVTNRVTRRVVHQFRHRARPALIPHRGVNGNRRVYIDLPASAEFNEAELARWRRHDGAVRAQVTR